MRTILSLNRDFFEGIFFPSKNQLELSLQRKNIWFEIVKEHSAGNDIMLFSRGEVWQEPFWCIGMITTIRLI